MPNSWRPEVQTDDTGQWYPNGLRFATKEEAERSAHDLAGRWFLVNAWRAAESDDAPNYSYKDGELRHLVDLTYNGMTGPEESE